MISQIDEALRSLVRSEVLGGTDVDVVLDAPTKDWAARRNAPTVDVYLYDIREDLRRRERGWVDVRGEGGNVIGRRPSPRHFKMSYLVTAWTQRPEDEHRLLAACLGCFLSHDRLPPEILVGSIRQLSFPVPYTIALPPPEDRALSDVWSALGGELKPSLDLVVTAPFDLDRTFVAGPEITQPLVAVLSDGETTETAGGADHVGDGRPAAAAAGTP